MFLCAITADTGSTVAESWSLRRAVVAGGDPKQTTEPSSGVIASEAATTLKDVNLASSSGASIPEVSPSPRNERPAADVPRQTEDIPLVTPRQTKSQASASAAEGDLMQNDDSKVYFGQSTPASNDPTNPSGFGSETVELEFPKVGMTDMSDWKDVDLTQTDDQKAISCTGRQLAPRHGRHKGAQ